MQRYYTEHPAEDVLSVTERRCIYPFTVAVGDEESAQDKKSRYCKVATSTEEVAMMEEYHHYQYETQRRQGFHHLQKSFSSLYIRCTGNPTTLK